MSEENNVVDFAKEKGVREFSRMTNALIENNNAVMNILKAISEGMVTIAQALDRNEKRLREIEHKLK